MRREQYPRSKYWLEQEGPSVLATEAKRRYADRVRIVRLVCRLCSEYSLDVPERGSVRAQRGIMDRHVLAHLKAHISRANARQPVVEERRFRPWDFGGPAFQTFMLANERPLAVDEDDGENR